MNETSKAALDLAPVLAWIIAAMTIVNFIVLMKNLLSAGEKKLEERVAKVEGKAIEHDRRIQSVEGDMKHLPNQETMHSIELTMLKIVGRLDKQDATLEGRFSAMDERLKPIQAIGERLNDVLVDQMKRAS
jgi:hypothetical protein